MGTLLCPPFNCGLLDLKSSPLSLSADDASPSLSHRNAFKDSFKSLEADVMHANTLLSGEMMQDSEGATLQIRLSFSPLAPLLLFLVNWADCSLAGALGLLRVLIYKVYRNGHSTANIYERKASLRQFSGYLYPALQQLYPGLSESEFLEQQRQCREKFLGKRRQAVVTCSCGRAVTATSSSASSSSSSSSFSISSSYGAGSSRSSCGVGGSGGGVVCGMSTVGMSNVRMSRAGTAGGSCEWRALDLAEEGELRSCCAAARAVEREREKECGICLEEPGTKVALPSCGHNLCQRCYRDWCTRSHSCPFCRQALSRVDSTELWEFVEQADVESLARITRDNIRRFFIFVHSLPVVFADSLVDMVPSEHRPLM